MGPVLLPETAKGAAVTAAERQHRWGLRLGRVVVVAADVVAVAVSLVVAFQLHALLVERPADRVTADHLLLAAGSLPLWLIVLGYYDLYSTQRTARRVEEWARIVHAAGLSAALMACATFMLDLDIHRGLLALTFPVAVAVLAAEREVVRKGFRRLRRRGHLLRPVIVVGTNLEAAAIATMLRRQPGQGYAVLGVVGDATQWRPGPDSPPFLGGLDDLSRLVAQLRISGVIVATTAVTLDQSNRLARELTDAGIRVELSSSLRDIAPERLCIKPIGRFPMVYVEPVVRHGWRAAAKRTLDVLLSGAGLVLALPALLAIGLAVKLDTRGPVLFKQERVGKDGELFKVLKFRTMVVNAEELLVDLRDRNEADGPLFKMKDDPRVTRVGKVLRALSLDELPQLWNVLRGEMSLVGPRPALEREITGWSPELHQRLRVKPGITGMWQISGRSDASFEDYARWDLYYVDNWSIWTDLAIVAKTIPKVFGRRGAY